jgi:hypothetical protein
MGALIARITMCWQELAFDYSINLRSSSVSRGLQVIGGIRCSGRRGRWRHFVWHIQSLGDGVVRVALTCEVCSEPCSEHSTALASPSPPSLPNQPLSLQVADVLYPIRPSSMPSFAWPHATTLPLLLHRSQPCWIRARLSFSLPLPSLRRLSLPRVTPTRRAV